MFLTSAFVNAASPSSPRILTRTAGKMATGSPILRRLVFIVGWLSKKTLHELAIFPGKKIPEVILRFFAVPVRMGRIKTLGLGFPILKLGHQLLHLLIRHAHLFLRLLGPLLVRLALLGGLLLALLFVLLLVLLLFGSGRLLLLPLILILVLLI